MWIPKKMYKIMPWFCICLGVVTLFILPDGVVVYFCSFGLIGYGLGVLGQRILWS